MRHLLATTLLILCLGACHTTPVAKTDFTHGDGSKPELAVDLSSAHNETEGIRAEKAWLGTHYPGFRVKSQALLAGPPMMDLLTVLLPSGEVRRVYFDISSFFGKL